MSRNIGLLTDFEESAKIVGNILGVFRINNAPLSFQILCIEQRCCEKLGKAIQRPIQVFWVNLEVVVCMISSRVSVRVATSIGDKLLVFSSFRILFRA